MLVCLMHVLFISFACRIAHAQMETDTGENVVPTVDSPFRWLPAEVLEQIFSCMSPHSVHGMRKVCSHWHQCATSRALWEAFSKAQFCLDVNQLPLGSFLSPQTDVHPAAREDVRCSLPAMSMHAPFTHRSLTH